MFLSFAGLSMRECIQCPFKKFPALNLNPWVGLIGESWARGRSLLYLRLVPIPQTKLDLVASFAAFAAYTFPVWAFSKAFSQRPYCLEVVLSLTKASCSREAQV